jgi:hypothetical protein
MTNPGGCRAPSARFPREATPSADLPSWPARGPLTLLAGRRAAGETTFAAHLEHLAKRERAGQKLGAPVQAGDRTDALAVDGAGESCPKDPTRHAEEMRMSDEQRAPEGAGAGDDPEVRNATLDPMVQVLGALAPRAAPVIPVVRPEPAAVAESRTAMEHLMAKLVRRVAWSGNGRTGVARLELGAGELEGATLTIQADDGRVHVALDLPPGVDRAAWKTRISERLAIRGLQVEAVEVA